MPESIADRIAEIYASESRRVLATLIRLLGDIDHAEEALQEAFGAALIAWPKDGIPRNPRAWLVSAGRFKGIDAIRRQGRGNELILQEERETARTYSVPEEWDGDVVEDDQLRLIFTCCHPALPVDARIALSLRQVCGLTTEEIARSFLVPVETMKKRISRAKATIREKRIPYEVPSHADLAERLDAVLHVVYLVYNEGHSATSGTEHVRRDLAAEAVFLSRLLADLLPEPEATGLLALLLLHESRSAARTDCQGDLVPLEDQRRQLTWQAKRADAMIRAVDAALAALDEEEEMESEKLFEGFDPAEHEDEVSERWGGTNAYAEAGRRTKGYGKKQWQEIKVESEHLLSRLAEKLEGGAATDAAEVMDLAEEHRMHIDRWYYPCDHAMHVGLGEMYVADERFAAHFEKRRAGLAAYLAEAICANAERR